MGDSLIRRVDFFAVQTRLFSIVSTANARLSEDKYDAVESNVHNTRRVMQRAIGLWVACTMFDGTLFEKFSKSPELFGLFLDCLKSPVLEVRREISTCCQSHILCWKNRIL